MKREYRLRDMIKEGILDIFYIWKDELKNVFKDEGVLIFFFLVPFAYPLLYSFIYNNEVVREAKMVVVDQSDSYLSREFTRRVNATPDVRVVAVSTDMEEAKRMLDRKEAYGILYFPTEFSKNLHTGKQTTVPLYCDEFGTMPPFDVLPLFSAGRSRRLTLVPIIQSLAQLEKNYGKEGSEIIQDNCQDTIFGGFAPNSQTAEVLSKALGNRTVLSGSVSRGKNDPSQSLQMMERPLLTPDELKSIPKGNFIVQKTGQHPMRTRLRLFLEWGITFEEPYIVPERADRAVAYANREDLERNLPQSNKAENADMRGAYAVSGRGGIAHEPAVDKPRRRGGKQMKTYGEEDL